MLRFVADENFNNNIVRGLLLRQPELDIVRVQDVGLTSADDPIVLEWAFLKDSSKTLKFLWLMRNRIFKCLHLII